MPRCYFSFSPFLQFRSHSLFIIFNSTLSSLQGLYYFTVLTCLEKVVNLTLL